MKIKTFPHILLLLASSLNAMDFIDFGEAPEKWTAAPKNTELGQKILGYTGDWPVPLDQGRLLFNSRLRYEFADQQGLESSDAWTLRTRIGYETARFHGFYGLGEFENTWAMNLSEYQSTPPANGRTVIPDPRNNQVNQLFLGYQGYNSAAKGGRQVINLDNQRFVGAVAWRQNDQTFDAARIETEVIADTWVSYTYSWQVNRVFGTYATPEVLERFESDNHFVNVHYDGLPLGTLGAYFYYLDLGSDGAGASGNTTGLFYTGTYSIDEDWSIPVRAEYAFQTDNGATPDAQGSFFENYWHLTAGAKYTKYELGLGFENLGGNGTRSFQTPLATLHKFNGWADKFLTTPGNGLQDYYLYYNAGLPADLKLIGAIHYFNAESTSETYGIEYDIGLVHKFSPNLSALLKFAYYDGDSSATGGLASDITKVWAQVDFKL
ncbi:MAG: alginate export family protein [Verrucomicrobiales bacterium]